MSKKEQGFTLIELLIVIGIIALLAAAVIIAINPGYQFAAARDRTRESHLNSIDNAVLSYQIDNLGSFGGLDIPDTLIEICNLEDLPEGADPDEWCGELVNLTELTLGYISSIPIDPQGGINEKGTGYFIRRSLAEDKIFLWAKKSEEDVITRGHDPNLITNGMGQYGDLTNFSQFDEFDTEEYADDYGYGSFRRDGRRNTITTDELIPIDASGEYLICTSIQGEWEEDHPRFYAGIAPYDADGRIIRPDHIRWQPDSETELAEPLHLGDTEIYLSSSENWSNSSDHRRRGVGIHNYTNDQGYTYPAYTYTRHVMSSAYNEDSIDYDNHIVYLDSGWGISNPDEPDGVWPAGTKIANQRTGGGTYMYTAASNPFTPSEWTEFCGTISGLSSAGTRSDTYFWHGTEYVRGLWLLNRTPSEATTTAISWIDNTVFEQIK